MNYWGEKASKKGSLLNTCGIKKNQPINKKEYFEKIKTKAKTQTSKNELIELFLIVSLANNKALKKESNRQTLPFYASR